MKPHRHFSYLQKYNIIIIIIVIITINYFTATRNSREFGLLQIPMIPRNYVKIIILVSLVVFSYRGQLNDLLRIMLEIVVRGLLTLQQKAGVKLTPDSINCLISKNVLNVYRQDFMTFNIHLLPSIWHL